MASMKDIAEEARVSITTFSHVINGTRYVSPERLIVLPTASDSFVSPFTKEQDLVFVFPFTISPNSSAAVLTSLLGRRLADRIGEDHIIPYAQILSRGRPSDFDPLGRKQGPGPFGLYVGLWTGVHVALP